MSEPYQTPVVTVYDIMQIVCGTVVISSDLLTVMMILFYYH